MSSIFDTALERNGANHSPLTPLGFIARTAEVYPNRLAIIHGELRQTWAQMRVAGNWPAHCSSTASARMTRLR